MPRICSLSQQLGTAQRLKDRIERAPRALAGETRADAEYMTTGLAGAIETLQWLIRNEAAIKAAFAALKAAEARRLSTQYRPGASAGQEGGEA